MNHLETLLTTTAALLTLYALTCAVRPIGDCWRCAGAGRHRLINGERTTCRQCDGSGDRIRLGRRMWIRFVDARRDAR